MGLNRRLAIKYDGNLRAPANLTFPTTKVLHFALSIDLVKDADRGQKCNVN